MAAAVRFRAGASCMRLVCLVCALLIAPFAHALPRTATAPHLKVELLSEQATIAPGLEFWVGLNFSLEPGWHVYWVNPGDSGEPPRVAWRLPADFRAGSIQWPRPERIAVSSLVDYGYRGSVLLMVPVRAAPDAPKGKSVELAADVGWVVCREVCIPGRARLGISLPVAQRAEADATRQAVFEATRPLQPKPAPPGWTATASVADDRFVITVETGRPTPTADFFPLEAQQIANAAPQQAEAFERGIRIAVKKAEELLRTPATLQGVLAFPSGESYVIDVPIVATAGAPSGDGPGCP